MKPDPDDGSPEPHDLYGESMARYEDHDAYQEQLHALLRLSWPKLDPQPHPHEPIRVVRNALGEWSLRWYCPTRGYERSQQWLAGKGGEDEAGFVAYLIERYVDEPARRRAFTAPESSR
jgi:hypothetical protein